MENLIGGLAISSLFFIIGWIVVDSVKQTFLK